MKKVITLTLCIFCINMAFAQKKAIKITNPNFKKIITIKENKRIKVKTKDGLNFSGRFKIEENSIIIKNKRIYLSEIYQIKRNPLLISILTDGILIYGGVLTAGFGVIIGAFVNTSGFLLIIPAAALIYAGINSPNFSKAYKTEKNWQLEIITIKN